MNHMVIHYGLTAEQASLLGAALPDEYELAAAECMTDLIVTNAVCTVIDAANMDEEALRVLLAYYMDVGDWLSETVVWLGETELPELSSFARCNSFLDLLTNLDHIIAQAQTRYDAMQMYDGEYAYLPKHAIEESIEADINTALHRKYGNDPDPQITKRVRRELSALREVGAYQNALQDLAAAFEMSRWLKNKEIPFFVEYTTASGLIPYLLGITHTNPLPPHTFCPKCKKLIWKHTYKDGFDIPAAVCPDCGTALIRDGHDLIWQEYSSYGQIPTYCFCLPKAVREKIHIWLEKHWRKDKWESFWGPVKQEKCRTDAGALQFIFVLDEDTIHRDFHQRTVTAEQREDLVRLVGEKWEKHANTELPYPKTAAEALAEYTLIGDGHAGKGNIKCFLDCGLTVSDLICCREDVFHYLCDHGFTEKDAFRGMHRVRKGRGFPVITDEMRFARDKWVLKQCANIDYLPSKAADLERLLFQIRGGFAAPLNYNGGLL